MFFKKYQLEEKYVKAIDILMKDKNLFWCSFCNQWIENTKNPLEHLEKCHNGPIMQTTINALFTREEQEKMRLGLNNK